MCKIKLELGVFGFGFWFCVECWVFGLLLIDNVWVLGVRIEVLKNVVIFYIYRESYLMLNGI